MNMPLSPAAAARKAKVSRSSISRAIADGSLRATRRNNGHNSIAEADLEGWMARHVERGAQGLGQGQDTARREAAPPADQVEVQELRERLAQVTADLASATGRMEGMAGELAAVRELADHIKGEKGAVEARARLLELSLDAERSRSEAARVELAEVRSRGLWQRLLNRA